MIVKIIFILIKFLIMAVPVLISVAFLTLFERKILGYSQLRKGPNVIGIYGLLQPFADGVKLFTKEIVIPNHVNIGLYFIAPMLSLSIAITVWSLIPYNTNIILSNIDVNLLAVLAFSAISVYAILISGWGSNSKYAFLGAMRAAAQMISYEISLGLILITIILCSNTFNFQIIVEEQFNSCWYIFPLLPAAIMFFISGLAETHRAPFDLTEGESELVSGYNVEYSSMSFALFFLAEYSHIIFMSTLFSIIFLGGYSLFYFNSVSILFFKATFIIFMFIWIRTSFPRLRYDQLMYLLWKTYLPFSLSLIIITNSLLWALNSLLVY